jgi:hypothetical protein
MHGRSELGPATGGPSDSRGSRIMPALYVAKCFSPRGVDPDLSLPEIWHFLAPTGALPGVGAEFFAARDLRES